MVAFKMGNFNRYVKLPVIGVERLATCQLMIQAANFLHVSAQSGASIMFYDVSAHLT